MARLGHKKSRNGCVQCKRRRVKCDEKRPCSNCVRHHAPCSLVHGLSDVVDAAAASPSSQNQTQNGTTPANSAQESTSATTSPNPNPHPNPDPHQAQPTTFLTPSITPIVPPQLLLDLMDNENPFNVLSTLISANNPSRYDDSWRLDLELMHHFATSTSSSVCVQEHLKDVWRIEVPKLAYQSDYVMHGLLAIAALHLHHVRPDPARSLMETATRHLNSALEVFQTHLPAITRDNCNQMFVFSQFVAVFVFGNPHKPSDETPSAVIDGLAQIFSLSRGTREIVTSAYSWVRDGPMGPLLLGNDWQHRSRLSKDLQDRFDQLQSMIGSDDDAEARAACHEALIELIACFQMVLCEPEMWPMKGSDAVPMMRPDCEAGICVIWPNKTPPHYHNLLLQHRPIALVLLAYYGVLLNCDSHHWFMGDWGIKIVKAVHAELHESMRHYVQWPMKCVLELGNPHKDARAIPGGA